MTEYRITVERLLETVPKDLTVGKVAARDLRQILDRYEKHWPVGLRSLRRVQGHPP